MHPALELLWGTIVMLIYCIEGVILAFIPASWLPKKSVQGQNVLVTGAGSGLGRLMSLRFARLGCRLVLWDINPEGNETTAEHIRESGAEAFTFTVDLSSREDIYRAADKTKTDVGDIDIVVNNAGIVTGRKFMQCPDHLVERTMEVNTNAHFWIVKSFLPAMLKKNRGHIVTIASAGGLSGVTGLCDYCASKFAAVGFDESLRNELHCLGKDKVKTTVVCPFYINTGMFDGVQTKFPNILAILDQDYAIDKIMEAVLTNQQVLYLPKLIYIFAVLKSILPVKASLHVSNVLGINSTMDQFVGRQGKRD